MTTLLDYVKGQFPNHEIDRWDDTAPPDMELAHNTVVSYVIGTRDGIDLLSACRRSAPYTRLAALAVRPTKASIVPGNGEDPGGVIDVPTRRVAAFAAAGAILLGGLFTPFTLAITGSGVNAAVVGGFVAVIGAVIGAIVGGGRFAGERSVDQPRAPGRTITVIAAFLDDESAAATLARSIASKADHQVRIVNQFGGWRSPT
jgi:hypothetical protein